LDFEQILTSTEREQVHRQCVKHLESLSENQELPQYAQDHARKLKKDLSVKREKRRVTEEHDFMLLKQVQQENDEGIDIRLGIREKLKDTDKEPQVIDRPSEYSENSLCSTTLKQNNVDEESLENAILLFNESNEESIIEKVDINLLMDEIRLPDINDRTPEEFLDTNLIESFRKYQKKIPKARKILTPAYWGVLDLTKESLKNSGIQNEDIEKLSRDFSNKIGWNIEVIIPNEVRKYFDNNCENIDKNEAVKRLDINIQKDKMSKLQKACTEEELKMWTTVPMISSVFTSRNIETTWGEIQAIPTTKARNETKDPFSRAKIGHKVDMKGILVKTPNKFEIIYGEVSGGLGSFGLPSSCSTELKIYAMDWIGSGIYRFGKLDECSLPVDEDDSKILEDAYCILNLLESKLLESEKTIKDIIQSNMKNKRRCIGSENSPHLNKNRTPQ
ncbi:15327_t:CDS:10, partial [Funneliformis geosporum]